MKKITNTFITVYLLFQFAGCQHSNERTEINNEYKNLDSIFIDELIPDKIPFKEGVFLTSNEKLETDFLLYLNNYIFYDPEFRRNQLYEKLYVSRLFHKKSNSIYIKHYEKFRNESEYEEIFKYTFNSNNKVVEISDIDYKYHTIKFNYNSNNQFSTIVIPTQTIPLVQSDNHNINHISSKKYTNELIYTYDNQKLISEKTKTSNDNKLTIDEIDFSFDDPVKQFYRFTKIGTSITYIKIIDSSAIPWQHIIGIKNELPHFIAKYSKKSLFGEFSKKPDEIILFSYNQPFITIKLYDNNPTTNKMELRSLFEIKRSSDYRLEAIKEVSRFINQEPRYIEDYHFEYHYSNNELLGFNIFKREYNYDLEPSEIDKIDYELEEYFHKIK